MVRCSTGYSESLFTRLLRPEAPRDEVIDQFTDVIYRWRALTLTREIAESAESIAEMSEAEFERFAALQQEVASVGLQHETDDAPMRDAKQRLSLRTALARLKNEPPSQRPPS